MHLRRSNLRLQVRCSAELDSAAQLLACGIERFSEVTGVVRITSEYVWNEYGCPSSKHHSVHGRLSDAMRVHWVVTARGKTFHAFYRSARQFAASLGWHA
ncbi:MAG: hypothetical protein QOF14_4553 [Hyphomicrobiales bacterium]|jgi:hypothetical protein|nr:hypothetical protein [Hyphomicrobiales bacterium]